MTPCSSPLPSACTTATLTVSEPRPPSRRKPILKWVADWHQKDTSVLKRHLNRFSAMSIPTEPIGSIPPPPELVAGINGTAAGKLSNRDLNALFDRALQDTIRRFEATGSPVITDGEQTKPSFLTYPIHG